MFKPAFAALLVLSCYPATASEFAAIGTDDGFSGLNNSDNTYSSDTYSSDTYSDSTAIEHISIYANRTATLQQDVLASITVLERDDIVARQANDLPDLLANCPGLIFPAMAAAARTAVFIFVAAIPVIPWYWSMACAVARLRWVIRRYQWCRWN